MQDSLVFTELSELVGSVLSREGGGVLPYSTYTGMCAQRGRDFEAPDLERGIHFRGVF